MLELVLIKMSPILVSEVEVIVLLEMLFSGAILASELTAYGKAVFAASAFSKPLFGFTAFLNYSSPLLSLFKKTNKQILVELNQLILKTDKNNLLTVQPNSWNPSNCKLESSRDCSPRRKKGFQPCLFHVHWDRMP